MPSTSAPASGWPDVCVFGAGAVGCYFGARLAMAGAPVTLIARGPHVQAIEQQGLIFESAGTKTSVRLTATTEPDAVSNADLVLFCVKSRDTDNGARAIAARLKPGAVVVSLQNGVDNVARMRAAAGLDALAAVVYVACSMAGPGHVRHAGRGDLVLGDLPGAADVGLPHRVDRQASARIAAVFERAGVPCPVSGDVRIDLWVKLVMNCVFNPISALGRAHYARLVADAPTRVMMRDVIAECVQVARADGVNLPSVDELLQSALTLGHAMAQATSSTAQDLAAGRPTEIDSLNGYVARRAGELHLAAPVNHALRALVKLAEG
jgi:2-dehydropantoate 2-reductase